MERTVALSSSAPSILRRETRPAAVGHTSVRPKGAFGIPAIRQSLLVTALTGLSKLLGFGREVLIAHRFGTAPIVDAYRIGETIATVGGGVFSTPFELVAVPLLVEGRIRGGERDARDLFATLWNVALFLALLVSSLILVFAPLLVKVFNLRMNPETGHLALSTTRIMAVIPAALILIALAGAYHNAARNFGLPRLTDPIINAVAIAIILFFGPHSRFALAAGWGAGHLCGLAVVLAPLLFYRGFPRLMNPARVLRDPRIKEFIRLTLPLTAFIVIRPINLALGRVFASLLPSGSIAILGYADRLFAFPCSLIAASIGTVFLTRASELAAAGKIGYLRVATGKILKITGLVLIPLSLLSFIFAPVLVHLVYEHGAFTSAATRATSRALVLLGLGIYPYTGLAILTAYHRAKKDTKTPVRAALIGALCTAAFNLALVRPLGISGLALGSTLGLTVNMATLLGAFSRDRHHTDAFSSPPLRGGDTGEGDSPEENVHPHLNPSSSRGEKLEIPHQGGRG